MMLLAIRCTETERNRFLIGSSRDYLKVLDAMSLLGEYGLIEDKRFVRARKEALTILCIVVADTIWVFGFALWGYSSGPENYTYVLGLPLWLLFASIGCVIVAPLASVVFVAFIKNETLESVCAESDVPKTLDGDVPSLEEERGNV